MEDPAIFDDHKKEVIAAETFYFGLRRVWCPALNDFVYFEKLGFRHLIQKRRKFRIKSEQRRRFALLPYVPIILKDENAVADVSGHRYVGKVKYWAFKAVHGENNITVIVMQIKQGRKYFLSTYEKKQKPTN
jgi:hypothetical protein